MAVTRKANAKWFIPTENEWYKAAYYQPAAQGGDSDSYWSYAMKTNSAPYSDQPPGATPDNTRVGNFRTDDGVANGYDDGFAVTGSTSIDSSQNYLTDVGAYASSPGFYGTFDQGGNVREWNETADGGSSRGVRDGSWFNGSGFQHPSARAIIVTSSERYDFGFRVASIPEPASALLAVNILALLAGRRSRR
jgi:formylglycine-generating enzyme required for sulfatase activity